MAPTKREAALVKALRRMMKAHADLLPGLQHIAVADYAIHNDARIEAEKAIKAVEKSTGKARDNFEGG